MGEVRVHGALLGRARANRQPLLEFLAFRHKLDVKLLSCALSMTAKVAPSLRHSAAAIVEFKFLSTIVKHFPLGERVKGGTQGRAGGGGLVIFEGLRGLGGVGGDKRGGDGNLGAGGDKLRGEGDVLRAGGGELRGEGNWLGNGGG